MSSEKGWVTPFLAGIVTAMAANAILQRKSETKETKSSQANSSATAATAATSNTGTTSTRPKIEIKGQSKAQTASLMDTPTLDNRILRKAEAALRWRTSRLILVIERCTNDHNYSAILRTAEALGVQHVYIIAPQVRNSTLKFNGQVDIKEESFGEDGDVKVNDNVKLFRSTGQQVRKYTAAEVQDRANHHLFAQRAVQWLQVKEFQTTKECIDVLRKDGYQIWSTDLSQVAVTLDEEGLRDENCEGSVIPEKLAIVFGTEAVGCTAEILNASDKRVYLPLRGFADSLNLSVATALVVHQLFILDPTLIGAMPEEERIELRRHWYAKLCTQRLQTKSAKNSKKRLTAQIQSCEEIEARANDPSMTTPLHPEQVRALK